MLQPLQIRDVSRRYGAEIAELRDFLAKAGVTVGTGEALQQIVARLQTESGFHRDLTSHVWVMIDRSEGRISYPDLLGVVAVAAADESLAAETDERDALGLLGFLMEARRSMPPTWKTGHDEHPPTPVAAPAAALPIVHDEQRKPQREAELPLRPEFLSEEDEPQEGRGWAKWAVAAACVLAVLLAGFWISRTRTNPGEPAAVTASVPVERNPVPAPTSSAPTEEDRPVPPTIDTPLPAHEEVRPSPVKKSPISPSKPAAGPRSTVQPRVPVPPGVAPSEAKATSMPSPAAPVPSPAAASPVPASTSTPAPVLRSAAPSTALPFPGNGPAVSPLKRMGSPVRTTPFTIRPVTLPRSTVSEADQPQGPYPQLKRRRAAGDTSDLVAEAQPDAVMAKPAVSAGTAAAGPTGVVRPTSLGMMAANVLYSPAPVYPPAASAAHVEGEVRVRIEVTRDGSVASASVISGPPLLRDAALDAVQRWKYRPMMAGGKPVATSAMAVLDFELQK